MRFSGVIILFFLITSFAFPAVSAVFSPTIVHATELQDAQAQRAALEAQLAELEKEIAQKQNELSNQKGQSASLSRDIGIITTQITKAKLDIQAKNLTITKLSGEIKNKSNTIVSLTNKMDRTKESLAELLKKTNELDDANIVHVILGARSVSDFYADVESFSSIKSSIKQKVEDITATKKETEGQKKQLEQKQNAEIDAKVALENAKHQVEVSESQKQTLLSISKNKESEYQKVIAAQQAARAKILSALFALRDTGAIKFGDALQYAKLAEAKTGVRPAFLLAIITQESNLGTDEGSCYLTDIATGAGIGVRSGSLVNNVMKPGRDTDPFLTITQALGRDPYKTRVSCPIGGYGYGGAMGPAQFIPSTWMSSSLRTPLIAALSKNNPDPWVPMDAFMASSIFLSQLGAGAQTYTSERDAACKYYSGRGCSAPGVKNASYGNSVMALAKKIQETMIDPLGN